MHQQFTTSSQLNRYTVALAAPEDGAVYVNIHARSCYTNAGGSLVFLDGDGELQLAFASGTWRNVRRMATEEASQ